MKRLVVATVLATLAAALPATAQKASAPIGNERRTVIDMEEDVVEGGLHQPDHVLVIPQKRKVFRSLIQVRKDFRKEVLASGAQL